LVNVLAELGLQRSRSCAASSVGGGRGATVMQLTLPTATVLLTGSTALHALYSIKLSNLDSIVICKGTELMQTVNLNLKKQKKSPEPSAVDKY
jgi:hypothetical protein